MLTEEEKIIQNVLFDFAGKNASMENTIHKLDFPMTAYEIASRLNNFYSNKKSGTVSNPTPDSIIEESQTGLTEAYKQGPSDLKPPQSIKEENIDDLGASYLENLKKVLDTGLNTLITNLRIRANRTPSVREPFEEGQEVLVYDCFRFAIPLKALIVFLPNHPDEAVKLRLLQSNNPHYPVGAQNVWVHRAQLKPIPKEDSK